MANYNWYNPYALAPTPAQVPAPAPMQSGIIWVQGEAGAKSYLVGAGQSVLLMDSESNKFYIKSTDNSGMPMKLRVFEYKEIDTPAPVPTSDATQKYVTHDELKKWTDDLLSRIAREEAQNGTEPIV